MEKAEMTNSSLERSRSVRYHISLTFVYKIAAVGLSFILVPLTIDYLDVAQYGIWMTLLSVMSWITFFDIGLGNGMRNKLAEALANDDISLAKTYVSTAYTVIAAIAIVFFVVLVLVAPFTPWQKVFNTTVPSKDDLMWLILTVGFFFILNFVLSLSKQVFFACQKASMVTLNQLFLNLFAVLIVIVLTRYTDGRLLYLGVGYGFSMLLASFVMLLYFFKNHRELLPSLKYVDMAKTRVIASLGAKFFVIQMAVLVIFATDNMIITQVLGPEHVTPYNVVFKLFSIVTILHGIISAPLWSAYTDAFAKGDFLWIKRTLKKLNLLMLPIILSVVVIGFLARGTIIVWVGPQIKFSNLLVVLMGVFAVINVWNNIYAYFVNGIGEIKLQFYSAIFSGILNIPLSIYFAKHMNMGSSGVILGTIVSLSLFAIIGPLQSHYILKNKVVM